MKHKIFSIILMVACTVALTIIPASASIQINPYEESVLSPHTVIFVGHDDVYLSLPTQYNQIGTNWVSTDEYYEATVDFEPNLLTIEMNDSFESVTMLYGAYYYGDFTIGPVRSNVRYTLNNMADSVVASVTLSYVTHLYTADGVLRHYDTTNTIQGVQGQKTFDIDFGNIYDSAGHLGWVDNLEITIVANHSIESISMTNSELGEYGLVEGERIPDSIDITNVTNVVNPNILEWLTSSVTAFTTTPIFQLTDGVNITIGQLMFVLCAIPLAITFLKFFAGG